MMTLAVQLDAFKHNYINERHSPFLYSLKENGVSGRLIPPFGFEPDAAYLAGLHPEECDHGMHYWYSPENSVFYFVEGWGNFAQRFPYLLQRILGKIITHIAQRSGKCKRMKVDVTTAHIPFPLLCYFDIVNKSWPFEKGFCPRQTVFDLLRGENREWLYIGAPIGDSSAEFVCGELKNLIDDRTEFVFLSIGDLDYVGHRFGPESEERKQKFTQVDEYLAEIFDFLEKKYGKVTLLIWGDHGMVAVKNLINIKSKLDGLGLRLCEDYVYFLDSTFARFWLFDEEMQRQVIAALSHLDAGCLIKDREKDEYRINYGHNRFGELIWWADGGTLIFPNFWQDKKPVKGMHGYRREVTDNHAGLLLYDPDLGESRQLKEPLEMVDVFATMVDILGLEMPGDAHGRSIRLQRV